MAVGMMLKWVDHCSSRPVHTPSALLYSDFDCFLPVKRYFASICFVCSCSKCFSHSRCPTAGATSPHPSPHLKTTARCLTKNAHVFLWLICSLGLMRSTQPTYCVHYSKMYTVHLWFWDLNWVFSLKIWSNEGAILYIIKAGKIDNNKNVTLRSTDLRLEYHKYY